MLSLERWPRLARALLSALAGAAYGAAFPHPGWWWLAVPAVAVWIALALSAQRGRIATEGWLAGFVAYGVMLRWFINPIEVYSTLGPVAARASVVMSAAVMGFYTVLLFAALARCSRQIGLAASWWAAPLLWTGWETLREWIPFPFPWGSLAAAHAMQGFAAPVAALVGATGLSILLALLASTVARWMLRPSQRAVTLAALATLPLVGAFAVGTLIQVTLPQGPTLRVAVLQAAISREQAGRDKLEAYFELSLRAARDGAQLLVWPESATGYEIDTDAPYQREVRALVDGLRLPLVLTSVTQLGDDTWQNSSVLLQPGRGITAIAPKRQLVPFGEYLPLRPLFGELPALATTEDFVPGSKPLVMQSGSATLGPLVCFEAVFPELARELAQSGANLLINQTNDSWFGTTGGPQQHVMHAVLRSAETGRPMARAASTGISLLIDRRGRVVAEQPLMKPGYLIADLELGTRIPPGSSLGRVLAGACATLAAAAMAWSLICGFRERRARPHRSVRAVLPQQGGTSASSAITGGNSKVRGDDA